MIWGVCGGLAKYFGIDPVIIRIIFVLLIFLSGIGILAYIILAIVVPLEESKSTTTSETVRENIEEMKETANELGRELRTSFEKDKDKKEEVRRMHHNRPYWFGIIIIIIGIIFLLRNFFHWFSWDYIWPVILIAIGLLVIFTRRRS
jgi:phage shock protein PspC (stress-responsive transcriptional regulator)